MRVAELPPVFTMLQLKLLSRKGRKALYVYVYV